MSSQSAEPRLMDHEYDGIQEFDNPAPGWWSLIFILSCMFALIYSYYYHFGGPGLSEKEEYAAAAATHADLRARATPAVDEAFLTAKATDPAVVQRGRDVYMLYCQSCHKETGIGLVGPNLTDDFQLHGTSRLDIFNTVTNGVPEKGMVPWGPVLSPDDIVAVSGFVANLRHTNVAGGREPQGERVEPFVR